MAWRVDRNRDPSVAEAQERAAGWRRGGREVARRFELEPDGNFVARDERGALLGTCSCFVHPGLPGEAAPRGSLAWIGGMVVQPEARSQGIGRALLRAALEHARVRGAATVGLDATEMGRPLYESEGFRAVAPTHRWAAADGRGGDPDPSGRFALHPFSRAELSEVADYDAERFGANRARWVAAVLADRPHAAFLARDRSTGALAGFVLGQEDYVGPLVADDARAAARLLWAAQGAGVPARCYFVETNAEAARALGRIGYGPEGITCLRMVRGNDLPGNPAAQYAVGAWALG